MQRRSFIQQSAFTIGALSLSSADWFSPLFQDPWKITMLEKEIGIFTERGGTILFLLSKDGIVTVDTQFPEQSKHLIDELKKKTTVPVKLVINTHHHGDHSGGNPAYKGITDHILAHANSLKNQQAAAEAQKSTDKQLFPDQTYTETWCQRFGKENVCLHYFGAGHTNGDSLVHFEHANIVHMGDLLFNRRHPYVDRSAGANIRSWMEVLDKAVHKFSKKTRFVYGHAAEGYEVTGKMEDLTAFQEYLGNLLGFVEKEIKAGKTKEEVLKTTVLPFTSTWKGDGLQRPLQAAYEELTTRTPE